MAKLTEDYDGMGWGDLMSRLLISPEGAEQRDAQDKVKAYARQELLMGLARRHLDLIKLDRTDEAPDILEVDTRQYRDPAFFAREKSAIFDRMPVIAGLSLDVAKPGDYVRLNDLEQPVFLTRNKDGKVKAFLNGCRHRGTEMLHDERGGGKPLFTCPYHGWSYDLNGALVGVPCGRAFEPMDKDNTGLTELACEERHGIIFMAPNPGIALDLDRYISPGLAAELSLWDIDKMQHVHTGPIHIDGNWKLTLDSFMESYHFAVGHAKNLAFITNVNVSTFDQYDKHVRITISRNALQRDLETMPLEELAPTLLNYFTIAYNLFPCTVLLPTPSGVSIFRLFPQSVDKTIIQYSSYTSLPLDAPGNREAIMEGWQQSHDIILTDDLPYAVIGATRTMRGGALPKIILGRNEQALQALQRGVHQVVQDYETKRN